MAKPEGKFAWTARMGEKGQIVIPKEARDIFGFEPGDTLLLLGDVKQGLAIAKPSLFAQLFQKVLSEGALSEETEDDTTPDEVRGRPE
ncbi:MAG: AbrB/MazE/SpoVT family DNA-binding domain-containing protein [Propionibacteriaceae bacterium]|jgi:AbrB family looped-hinge helix DNA binding protein|nr:AbrB/MazE/SpoVT family DNA-binding domain-containing protein [Propionibacteriaceae bacterium]